MSDHLRCLLALLSDTQVHSGKDLAQSMGLSRTAIWKWIKKLEAMGVPLEIVKGRGYRLSQPIEVLAAGEINGFLPQMVREVLDVHIYQELGSTNVQAMRLLANGQAAKGYVCLAEYQSAGRGRRGNAWFSPFGYNVYLSLVWEFEGGAACLQGLSLLVGLVVAEVLQAEGIGGVRLKWPNDILLGAGKLGGVLLEMSGDLAGCCQVIIGVGLNLYMEGAPDLGQSYAMLFEQKSMSRNMLIAKLLSALVYALQNFEVQGFLPYRSRWQSLDAYYGQAVRLISGKKTIDGVSQGVAEDGALLVCEGKVVRKVYGGEVSLRLKHDT